MMYLEPTGSEGKILSVWVQYLKLLLYVFHVRDRLNTTGYEWQKGGLRVY